MARWGVPLVIAILAITAFQWRVQYEMVDFAVYRQAATRVAHAEPLYQTGDGHYQFKYLPAFAIAALPLTLVDESAAKMMWFAASIGALVLLVRWSVRFLPERRRGIGLLIALTALFMAKFYAHELVLGQSNIFFALLAISAIGALQLDADAIGGGLLGAAVCIKPYALVFAPWLLVNGTSGNRRALVAFATVCAVVLIAPAAIYGIDGNFQLLADWWRTVSLSTAPNLTGADNVSLAAMWTKWLGANASTRLLTGLSSAAALGLVIDAWMRRNDTGDPIYLEAAALLLLVPLLSPQGWDYVLLLATPAVALLFDRLPELSRGWQTATWGAVAIMGLVTFDLIGRTAYARFMAWSIISLAAITLLVCLTQLRRLKLA
jgi:hypothetical protein